MDRIIVNGGRRLSGEVAISGSKNSTLALMAAALLTDEEVVLRNVPRVRDVDGMLAIFEALGAKASWDSQDPHAVRINASNLCHFEAPYDLVRKMRASFMVMGPLVTRFGQARVSEPGGCAIGVRPIDQHLKGIEALGGKVRLDHGYVEVTGAPLVGANFSFDITTVNGTQNVMMAATLAKGETVLENAAREPEVVELAEVLRKMGADIEGEGTDRIVIRGVTHLRGIEHRVAGDRIEAGTLLCAAAITKGDVWIRGVLPETMGATLEKLREIGVEITVQGDSIRACVPDGLHGIHVTTAPYPGFATDMQAQIMALLLVAEGSSVVTEKVFENRFMHVPELQRLGADITLDGRSAHLRGNARLMGAPVMATDLRASAGLLVAALAAEGETTVHRVYHIDRGYERIEEKLKSLGAEIRREG